MRKGLICLLMLLGSKLHAQNTDYDNKVRAYIDRYKGLAVAEQKRSGIPAAITLAQGIHETQAGNSELATKANNHFGIKCKKEWTGETFAHTDDAPNECFRKYARSEDSYKDHSDYLSKSPRYAELFKLSATDYAAWAIGLKACGYATNPRYAQVLIKLVEDYHLQEFTYAALNNENIKGDYVAEVVPENDRPQQIQPPVVQSKPAVIPPVTAPAVVSTPPVVTPTVNVPQPKQGSKIVTSDNTTPVADNTAIKPVYGQIVKINGLRAIYARKGDTPLEYAYRGDVRYSKFLEINEIDERPLPYDMYLYLDKKNARGARPKHVVKPGETLFSISQDEGMVIKSLMDLNMLEPGEEPAAGTVLELQKMSATKPSLARKEVRTAPVTQQVMSASAQTSPVVSTPVQVPAKPVQVPVVAPKEDVIQQQTPVENNATRDSAIVISVVKEGDPVAPNNEVKDVQPTVAAKVPATIADPTLEEANKQPAKQPDAQSPSITGPQVTTDIVKEEIKAPVTEPQPMSIEPVASVEALPLQSNSSLETSKQEVAIKEVAAPELKREEEPKDELDRLKRKFDKVVYARDNAAPVTPQVVKQDTVKAAVIPEKKPMLAASGDASKYYTVKKGDTGHSIAKSHNITLRQLMEWNGLDFDDIKEGQKLRIKP